MIYKNKIDVYGFDFHTCFNEQDLKKLALKFRVCDDINTSKMKGCFLNNHHDMAVFINLDFKMNESAIVSVIAHESYHLANHLFNILGMEYMPNTHNEHAAYIIEYVTKKVHENYLKNKGEIK